MSLATRIGVIISLCCTLNLYGQTTRRVELYHASDGEPIVAAEIFQGEERIALTDENGAFTVGCRDEQVVLLLRYFGVNSLVVVPADTDCNEKFRIGLALSLTLQEVTVRSTQNVRGTSSATYGIPTLTRGPALLGQPDILRGLALRSGITHGQEGNANIFVRGGTPDQNLILLDDAPVYNVNHLGGFISIFNDDAINSVSVYKTTPPLVYGNRLSSVIDVRLRNGSDKSWRGKAGIGIVSASALIEGPLIKNKTTLIAGVRTGYLDLINIGIDKDQEEDYFDLRTSDYLIKLSHRFSNRHRLFLSSYRSSDANGIAENQQGIRVNGREVDRQFTKLTADYGNQTFSLRDYYEFANGLQLTSFAYYTDYRNGYDEIERTYDPELIADQSEAVDSRLTEAGGVSHLRFTTTRSDYRLGLSYSAKRVSPLNTTLNGLRVLDNPLASSSATLTVFGGYGYRFNERLAFSSGIRWSDYRNGSYRVGLPEMRLRLDYQLATHQTLSVSANRTAQDLHLISSGTLGQNTDAYVLAGEALPAQTGWQADVGYNRPLGSFGFLSLGYYYRRMNNVIFYVNQEQGVEETAAVLRKTRTQGTGFSHGLEMELEGKWRSLDVLVSYTLSRTRQRFSDINNGQYFPFRYDRTHDVAVNLGYALGEKYSIGTSFIFQTGIAVTTPTARVPASANFSSYNVVPSINNARFPAYNRLDLSVTRDWKGKRDNRNVLRLSIYNLYNRVNPTYYSSVASGNLGGSGDGVITVRTLRVGQFGFLPTLYYSREFGRYE